MEMVRYSDFFAHQGWYPGSKGACLAAIGDFEDYYAGMNPPSPPSGQWHGGVVPHAGWVFSGRLAFRVFQVLSVLEGRVGRIVLFGGHLSPKSSGWILSHGVWKTPLGEVRTDADFSEALAARCGLDTFYVVGPGEYEPDNTIELQLPFVRHFFPGVSIVVAGVPASEEGRRIGATAAELARNDELATLFVGSTDLTHYGPNYGFLDHGLGRDAVDWVRKVNDRKALDAFQALDPQALLQGALENKNACCPGAAAAAMTAGRTLGASRGEILEYATSYDVRPDMSFVGYAAVGF